MLSVEEDQDPVRVSRFEWERLMMLSDLPEQDRFRLLAIGIFMDGGGGLARPGNAGLAKLGPHEETWKKLLRRTVKARWLLLVSRGGARRGSGGTTIRRASVYAAAVPREVWERREEILSGSPFRAAADEGSPNPLKEAPEDFLQESTKEAPEDFLQDSPSSMKEAPETSFESFEGSPQGLPHQVPTTSLSSPPTGGGQASSDETEQKLDAFVICQPLIQGMTDAGLTVSWQMQPDDWRNVARVVQRAGVEAMVDFARGVKTREKVRFARFYLKAGWLGLPPKSTRPQPGLASSAATADLPPYCGDIDCDERTRFRDHELDTGHHVNVPCPECHPSAKKEHTAA